MANQIVWVDIPVVDLDRAVKFYSAVLGSPVQKQEYPGMTIGLLPGFDGENTVSGCLFTGQDGKPSVTGILVYLNAAGASRRGRCSCRAERRKGSAAQAPDRPARLSGRHSRQRRQPDRAPLEVSRSTWPRSRVYLAATWVARPEVLRRAWLSSHALPRPSEYLRAGHPAIDSSTRSTRA